MYIFTFTSLCSLLISASLSWSCCWIWAILVSIFSCNHSVTVGYSRIITYWLSLVLSGLGIRLIRTDCSNQSILLKQHLECTYFLTLNVCSSFCCLLIWVALFWSSVFCCWIWPSFCWSCVSFCWSWSFIHWIWPSFCWSWVSFCWSRVSFCWSWSSLTSKSTCSKFHGD